MVLEVCDNLVVVAFLIFVASFESGYYGVRGFDSGPRKEPVHWKEWPYTFNTACFNCHVSQLNSNYDLATDTYRTTWAEPGINCETCHGPSKEHNDVMQAAPKGQVPPDLKIISVKKFTHEQHNASCGSCHAKTSPLTTAFPARGPVLRPLRSGNLGKPGLLSRRPGPGRELYLHHLAHEPLR